MKYITIASDVSQDYDNKISTWACYICYGGGVIQHVAEFREFQTQPHHAEAYALINAIVIAAKNIPDWDGSRVIIYNEIPYALTPLLTKAGNIRRSDVKRTEAIRRTAMPLLDRTHSWELRHVKAHFKDWQKAPSPARYRLNRWCDTAARNHMRYLRRKKKGLVLK